MPATNGSVNEHFSPYRSDGKLYGFVCIVTGATQPIGRAIVAELAAHGAACVYACSSTPDNDISSLEAAAHEQNQNTKVIGYPFKLATEEDTLALIDDVLNVWGRLDVWVTTTNPVLGPRALSDTTPSDLYTTFQANALAPFFALKYAPSAMAKTSPRGTYANATPKDQPYGSIIVVTSVASQTGGVGGPAFTMSCHAALGVVRSGVAALVGTGVRINAIAAGQIDVGGTSTTGATAAAGDRVVAGVQRAGLPEEVARVAGFLASGFSSYVMGAAMVVDGGASAANPAMMPLV